MGRGIAKWSLIALRLSRRTSFGFWFGFCASRNKPAITKTTDAGDEFILQFPTDSLPNSRHYEQCYAASHNNVFSKSAHHCWLSSLRWLDKFCQGVIWRWKCRWHLEGLIPSVESSRISVLQRRQQPQSHTEI